MFDFEVRDFHAIMVGPGLLPASKCSRSVRVSCLSFLSGFGSGTIKNFVGFVFISIQTVKKKINNRGAN